MFTEIFFFFRFSSSEKKKKNLADFSRSLPILHYVLSFL